MPATSIASREPTAIKNELGSRSTRCLGQEPAAASATASEHAEPDRGEGEQEGCRGDGASDRRPVGVGRQQLKPSDRKPTTMRNAKSGGCVSAARSQRFCVDEATSPRSRGPAGSRRLCAWRARTTAFGQEVGGWQAPESGVRPTGSPGVWPPERQYFQSRACHAS